MRFVQMPGGSMSLDVKSLIPQREPFLFIDKIIECSEKIIVTSLFLTGKEEFFKGHFPGNPIMPGVLLQEAIFQSGAALMAASQTTAGLGVVTRVQNAKFKNIVRPGDTLIIHVELLEKLANASYMKGNIKVNNKTVVVMEFAVAEITETI
jgi:3-hydroxyacyl-[acyl-carrier-protein] dehydratase